MTSKAHFISASCGGEVCGFLECREPATHKVGEEIASDDPNPIRHNLTRYVCCFHFTCLFGSWGVIDLDPASNSRAQIRVRAATFYGKSEDGLARPWSGRVHLNPPFSDPEPFTSKLTHHYRLGDVPAAILVVNNATETGWFQAAASQASGLCLPRKRMSFIHPVTGKPATENRYAQCVLYFGSDGDLFARVFSELGLCYGRPY